MEAGIRFAERFTIQKLAGRGGMGEVYQAIDSLTGEKVALKLLTSRTASAIDRFVREAWLLSTLSHPGIVRYIAHGQAPDGQYYLAMEWLEGEDLAQTLSRGRFTITESFTLCLRVAEALSVAHARGIIHRDLKPPNLFLPEGQIERVKILDFGIAGLGQMPYGLTRTGAMMGTLGYMAPEQASHGAKALDARADIFALGCILFECLTGRPAFRGENLMAVFAKILLEEPPRAKKLCSEVPEHLDALVSRMLAKNPADRPADASALKAELLPLADCTENTIPEREILPSLTNKEQLLFCVVFFRDFLPDETLTDPMATLPSEPKGNSEQFRKAAKNYGGDLAPLSDGSIAFAFAGTGTMKEHAERAARCAIELHKQFPLALIALAIGRGAKMDGTQSLPVGEVIDRAAQILSRPVLNRTNPTGEIRIDNIAAGLLSLQFDIRGNELGFSLLGETEAPNHVRTLLGKPTSYVGRERELSNLLASYEECVSEPLAKVVLVTAQPGIGKSRLCYEFMKKRMELLRGGQESATILTCRGDPTRSGAPFGLLSQAIRKTARLQDGEPPTIQEQKLRARLSRHIQGQELSRVSEFLGELVHISSQDESAAMRAARQDPRLMHDQMQQAFVDWLRAESGAGPILFILEDLHWGDITTVKLADFALSYLQEQPLFVLALARPEVHQLFPKLWAERRLEEIRLGALTKKAAERLVREVLGGVSDEVVSKLVAQSQGNAFFLEELCRVVAEGKGENLPETVLAIVQSRLMGLEPESRRLLRAASILGETFWRGGLVALLGEAFNASLLDDHLAILCEQELIQKQLNGKFPEEPEFMFRHGLLREAAYSMLTEADRMLGHQLAVVWLESVGESNPAVLALHATKGQENAKAATYYQRASRQSIDGNDFERALEYTALGIELCSDKERTGHLRLLRAEAHRWKGESSLSKEQASLAKQLLPTGSGAWFRALSEWSVATVRLGEVQLLAETAREAYQAPASIENAKERLVCFCSIASILIQSGKLVEAEPLLVEASQMMGSLGNEPAMVAGLHSALAIKAHITGDLGGALKSFQEVLKAHQSTGNERTSLVVMVNFAVTYIALGGYLEAEALLVKVLSGAARLGLSHIREYAFLNLAVVQVRLERLSEAASTIELVYQTMSQANPRVEGSARIVLAQILLQQNKPKEAEQEATRAVEQLTVAPPLQAEALAVLSSVLLAQRDADAALEAATKAMKMMESGVGIESGEWSIRLAMYRALHFKGEPTASVVLTGAKERLLESANKISDEKWRERFLRCVPVNKQLMDA